MVSKALNIGDVRALARRRLPRGIFDYIDRGAEDEVALGRLRRSFETTTFRRHVEVGQIVHMPLVHMPRLDLARIAFDAPNAEPLILEDDSVAAVSRAAPPSASCSRAPGAGKR